MICRHPNLEKYDLSSVMALVTLGSGIYPKYEIDIYYKFPKLAVLYNVITNGGKWSSQSYTTIYDYI